MLVFIIALQSRQVSRDWERVSALCRRTVGSILGQTSDAFHAIVVCHERPEGLPEHPRLTVVRAEELPIPATKEDRMVDKWDKVKRGAIEARRWNPTHVMVCDADDCVSRELAAWVQAHPEPWGWSFTTGYVYREGGGWLFHHGPGFDRYCGTSYLLRCSLEELPERMDQPRDGFPVVEYGHSDVAMQMAKRGRPFQVLPFVGAVYVVETNENDSGVHMGYWGWRKHFWRRLSRTRLLTRPLRAEFGLYPLS